MRSMNVCVYMRICREKKIERKKGKWNVWMRQNIVLEKQTSHKKRLFVAVYMRETKVVMVVKKNIQSFKTNHIKTLTFFLSYCDCGTSNRKVDMQFWLEIDRRNKSLGVSAAIIAKKSYKCKKNHASETKKTIRKATRTTIIIKILTNIRSSPLKN